MATEKKGIEERWAALEWELKKRDKELNCIYGIAALVEQPGIKLEELVQGIVDLMPTAWQYPEIACARAILEGQEFKTENFRETPWKQTSDIMLHGERNGYLELYYLEEKPENDEEPFLTEERNLINTIAERLGRITERVRVEDKFRIIFESTPDAYYLTDLKGKFINGNKAAERMSGYRKGELIGKSVLKLNMFPKDQYPKAAAILAKNALGVPTGPDKFTLIRKDGSEIEVEIVTHPVKIEGKIQVLGIARDITERVRAKEALRIDRDNLKNIFNAMEDGVYIVNQQYDIQYVNPVLIKDFGIYKGKKCYKYFHDRTEVCPWCKNPDVFAGKTVRWEWYSFKSQKTYDLIDTPLINPDGSISKLEIFRDITERVQAKEAILKERDMAQKYLDIAGFIFVAINAKGEITLINQKGCEILGYEQEEIIGKNWFDNYLPANTKDEVRTIFVRLIAGEIEPVEYHENPVLTKGGEEKIIAWHNTLLKDDEGNIIGTLSSGEDITERRQAEEVLHQYEHIVSSSTDMLALLDKRFNYLAANKAYMKAFKLTPEQLIGSSVVKVFGDEFFNTVIKPYAQLCLGGEEINYQDRFDFPAYGPRYTDITYYPYYDADNKIMGFVVNRRDITEREQAEENLRKSEQKFRNYVETSQDLMWECDAKGRFTYLNPAWEQVTDYKLNEMLGKPFTDFYIKEEVEKNSAEFGRHLEGGSVKGFPSTYISKNGSEIALIFKAIPLYDSNKNIIGTQGSAYDITERVQAEKVIRRYARRLTALHEIDQAITGSLDLNIVLNILLGHLLAQLEIDAAVVLRYQADLQTLEFAQGRGFRTTALQRTNLRLGQGFAGEVALQRRHIFIPDLNQDASSILESPQFKKEGFRAYYGVPLIAKGELVGVLEIFHRSVLDVHKEWLDFLDILADQAAITIDNINLFNDLQRSNVDLTLAYDATIEGWARALELRDKETEGHSKRVVDLTMQLARRLGISDKELVHVRRGALLHDIGKMGISDSILLKPGKLTDEEWEIIRQHPVWAYEMLSHIAYLRPALDIPYLHHEKWDGTGYPRGLKGEQIPLVARIFAIVDVWEALNSDRPYRKAWSEEKIIAHIQKQSGVHFDPQIVDEFLKMVHKS